MYCMKCGTTLNVDDKFCRSCGTPVTSVTDNESNQPWRQENLPKANINPSLTKAKPTFLSKWWFIILICFAFFIYSMVKKDINRTIIQEKILTNNDPWKQIAKEYEDIKIKNKLPARIDEYTIFKDMYVKNHEVNYVYSVSNIPSTINFKNALANDTLTIFQKHLCQDPVILEYDGVMAFTYQLPTGDLVYKYDKSSCLK